MNDHIRDDFYPSLEQRENQTVSKETFKELLQGYRIFVDNNIFQAFEEMYQEYRRFLLQPTIIVDSLSKIPTKPKVNWKKEGF